MLKYNATQLFIETFDSIPNKSSRLIFRLMIKAFKCNNTVAFNHIIQSFSKNADGSGSVLVDLNDNGAFIVIKYGNINMLRAYLAVDSLRSIPFDKSHLAAAVDTGNIEFVRLLFQNHCFDQKGSERAPAVGFFNRPGISIAMLTMLHEEFDALFKDDFWNYALAHCIDCRATDSIYYIVKHTTGIAATMRDAGIPDNCRVIDLLMTHSDICAQLLLHSDQLNAIIETAVEDGAEDVLKFLYSNHLNDMFESSQILLCKWLGVEFADGDEQADLSLTKLRVKPRYAINMDDIDLMESILPELDTIDDELWQDMSTAMARHITNPRLNHLAPYNKSSLCYLVKVASSDKNRTIITEDMVLNFIDNCQLPKTIDREDDVDENGDDDLMGEVMQAFEDASGYSVAVMQKIQKSYSLHYTRECLQNALSKKNAKTLAIILEQVVSEQLAEWSFHDDIKEGAYKLISTEQLSTVILVLDHLPSFKGDAIVCEWAIINIDIAILQYVLSTFTPDQIELNKLINMAMTTNNLNALQELTGFIGKPLPMPSLATLLEAVWYNCYISLEHFFDTIQFKNLSKIERLRTLYSLLDIATDQGHSRIIKHCTSLINDINSNKKRSREESEDVVTNNCDGEKMVVQASSRLETAIHLVFTDKKLCSHIVECVGHVHKSLGVQDECRIKGAQLLSKHSLVQYIRYGASEWFIKAYSSVSDTYPLECNLMDTAFIFPNTAILDTLLTNPRMFLNDFGSNSYQHLNELVIGICPHSQPEWESVLDKFLAISFMHPQDIEITEEVMQQILHPDVIRKLMALGFKLKTIVTDSSNIEAFGTVWLHKPWALEMFQLMEEHKLMSPHVQASLHEVAVSLGITSIVRYFVDTKLDQVFDYYDNIDGKRENGLFSSLMQPGCNDEIVEIVFPRIPFEGLKRRARYLLDDVASNGKLKLFTLLMKAINDDIDNIVDATHTDDESEHYIDPYDGLSSALAHNSDIKLVDFILSSEVPSYATYSIFKIKSKILSMELVQRLMTIGPAISCVFSKVLGQAIKVGNKEIIEMMWNSSSDSSHTGHKFSIDYHDAFKKALNVGDMDNVKRIIATPKFANHKNNFVYSREHFIKCIAKEPVSTDNNNNNNFLITDEMIIELGQVLLHPDSPNSGVTPAFNSLLHAAAGRSLSTIKLVFEHFSWWMTERNQDFKHILRKPLHRCIERGDIESIAYLMEKATDSKILPRDLLQLVPAPKISHAPVVSFLMDNGYLNPVDIGRLMDWACKKGHIQVLQTVYKRCTSPDELYNSIPSMESLSKASTKNRYQVLSYLFEDQYDDVDGTGTRVLMPSPINRACLEQSRIDLMLYVILHHGAFQHGNVNIIAMCDRIAKQRQQHAIA
ncbi:hypothetical protein SAMD00019534_001870 [Acytostelium subglobosum LB1]|uniref:hypothetical protein n=1 Tax=Acytostelium subglobosum LB1 TaxID=1410327 RepID=UPI000644CF61|nr:hypothetical protein SAMD00019534_001870 [Acytostelium subglobosum LB1]GAM17012.1 hypothetical protein SAMD00019534_001870 [Acytostelium subglobosum LB1]|eukprot:XP_012759074.1 hypothetical protein SAMD00019534_001870 [Acytostelium subglobosum LB1]